MKKVIMPLLVLSSFQFACEPPAEAGSLSMTCTRVKQQIIERFKNLNRGHYAFASNSA
jgi:hypothetical protein